MTRPPEWIVAEIYRNPGEPSSARLRIRALPGQRVAGEDVGGCNVQCSRALRAAWPPGRHLRMAVTLKRRLDGQPFLAADPNLPWEPLDR